MRNGHGLIVALIVALGGCTYYPATADWTEGGLMMRARFPRQVQIIPDGTRWIEVRVSGEGIPKGSVLAATLTPGRSETLFSGVPAGPKTVVVRAYGSDSEVLAAGSSEVTIVAGATVTARIRLSLLNDTGQFQLVIE